jgi:hypothetical protein
VEGHAEAVDEMTARRLAGIEEYMGWDDTPTYLLGAVPRSSQPVPIPGMYDPNRIYGCVSRPPEIRAFGFSLGRADTPRNEDGSLVNLSADRSVLWLDPDGTCLAAAAGSPAFLTRGQSSAGPERRDINATVLVEWSYLFCLFVEQCLAGAIEGGWVFMARLRGAHSRPWSLSLQPGHSRNFWQDGRAPGLDEWHMEVAGTGDPGLDSFHLLVGLYGLFGLDERSIPFVSDDRVDPDLIRATSG